MAVEAIDCIIRKWFVELWASVGSPKASGKVTIERAHTSTRVQCTVHYHIESFHIDFCDFHNAWFLIEVLRSLTSNSGIITTRSHMVWEKLTTVNIAIALLSLAFHSNCLNEFEESIWLDCIYLMHFTECTRNRWFDSIFLSIFFAITSNFIGSIWCRHLVPM